MRKRRFCNHASTIAFLESYIAQIVSTQTLTPQEVNNTL